MPHHTPGGSYDAIGILVLGDFDGITYEGEDGEPTHAQYRSLAKLLKHLTISGERITFNKEEIYGHYHFGRENDPGRALLQFIEDFKNFDFKQENDNEDST